MNQTAGWSVTQAHANGSWEPHRAYTFGYNDMCRHAETHFHADNIWLWEIEAIVLRIAYVASKEVCVTLAS